jgi:hypothetical protein
MSDSIVFANNFNTNALSVSAISTLKSGAKQAFVNYNAGKFIVQTPQNMIAPYGLGVNDKSKFGGTGIDYSLDLSLRGYNEEGNPVKGYSDMLQSIDDYVLNLAVKNSVAWFGKQRSLDSIRDSYKSSVKFAIDKATGQQKAYPPTHKLKLRKLDDKFETKFYNSKGALYKDMPIEDLLPKNVQLTVLIQCAGLWFSAAGFGLTWRAQQVVVHKLPERMKEFAFQGLVADEGDEEEEADESGPAAVDDDAALATPKTSAVAAMMPKPKVAAPVAAAPAKQDNPFANVEMPADEDEEAPHEAEDSEPIPAPAKKTVVTTKVVKKVVKPKA